LNHSLARPVNNVANTSVYSSGGILEHRRYTFAQKIHALITAVVSFLPEKGVGLFEKTSGIFLIGVSSRVAISGVVVPGVRVVNRAGKGRLA